MKRKLWTFLLAACLGVSGLLISMGQMSVVEAEESADLVYGEEFQRTFRTKDAADHLVNAGTYRGYYHDRQDLGIYLNEGAVLNICISNAEEFGQELVLDLLADDSAVEKTYTIPADGSWLSVSAEAVDCVPFIRTPQSTVEPTVKYYYTTADTEALTKYCYGDSQEAFLETWASNDQEFAVIDGAAVTFLVPRGDMEYLPGAAGAVESNMFASIYEMLDFYAEMLAFYDDFIGLSYTAEDPVDQNVYAKYFVKADKNGVGAAYYSAYAYVAQNAETIRGYLGEDYWMSLHEFGHGYDGDLANGDLDLLEVANNIFGHYFERTLNPSVLENGGNGWGNMQNMELIEGYYQSLITGDATFNSVDVYTRLYFILNLLNKNDAQTMMSELHHAWRAEEGTSTIDFIIEHFCEASGYDLTPYFERLGIYTSDLVKSRISEAGYPILNELRLSLSSDAEAQQAMETLNGNAAQVEDLVANGVYGLVSAEELSKLNKTGNLTVAIEIDDLSVLQGKEISVLDGEKIIASGVIDDNTIVFENIPIGTYHLGLPAADAYDYYADYTHVNVVASANNECKVVYHKAETNLMKNDARIQLLGLSDWLIATITTDIDAQTMTVQTQAIQPHFYFNNVYTSVKLLTEDGKTELYSKEYVGDTNYSAETETISAPVGSVIKIYHQEMVNRLKISSTMWGTVYDEYTEGFTYNTTEVSYRITENGLQRLDWDEDAFAEKREGFYKEFAALADGMFSAEAKENKNAYQKIKTVLVSAIATLDEEAKNELKASYPYLFVEEAEVVEDEIIRLAGDTRYGTAYAAADQLKEKLGVEKFEAVIVATGKQFADALSGSYLAAVKNAPILLTNGKDDNVTELLAYIEANVTKGGTVYILGGEAAVPKTLDVINGYQVKRLAGTTRYETNLAILEAAGMAGDELIIATGTGFADSLSASAAKRPILLVKNEVTDAHKAVLENYKGGKIFIVGGESAVSKEIETALKDYGTVTRVAGSTRYETSVEVAKTFFTDAKTVVLASAKEFPDGLCGGPLAAAMNAPLILTADGKTGEAAGYVEELGVRSGIVLGGTARIPEACVEEIFQ